jgi:cytidylate kinase
MPTTHLGDVAVARFVERQLRNWELSRAVRARDDQPRERPEVQEFVAISRQVASGGAEIAALLAERVGWPLFDKRILEAMAENDAVKTRLFATMDEHDLGWLEGFLAWLMTGEPRQPDYCRQLVRTVLTLARQSRAVFVGRGIDMILPRQIGLRVRILAPLEQRLAAYAARRGLDPKQAREEVERIEHERNEFMEHHFRRRHDDPMRWDLTLNLQNLTPAQAAEIIIAALRARGIAA